MLKNETGRSMVEMLGVLAIIGVLSIAGIAGYSMALKKAKANDILAAATQCGILARTYQGTGTTTSVDCVDLGLDALPDGATVMQGKYSGDNAVVEVTSADYCDAVKQVAGDLASACASNKTTLTFSMN